MTRLDAIRTHLNLVQRDANARPVPLVERWYADDVALLLELADAALAYRAATQVPDGVAAAEQMMFEALERLERPL